MQGKDFLYLFVDDMNRSLYVEQGIVKTSTTPRPLEYTPGGWQDIAIQNGRNAKYFALDRSFTIPLDAVEDGALILKDRFYNEGIEAKVFLLILKQHLFYDASVPEMGYYYKGFYKGEFDFSTIFHVGPKVTCNIMEGGLVKYLKAREGVTYEFDMNVPENEYIKMDGVKLQFATKYLITEWVHQTQANGTAFQKKNNILTLANIPGEISPLYLFVNSPFQFTPVEYEDFGTSEEFFLQALRAFDLNFHFRFSFDLWTEHDTRENRCDLYIVNQFGIRRKEFLNLSLPDGETNTSYNIDEQFTLSMDKDEKLFLVLELGTAKKLLGSGFARIRAAIRETEMDITHRTTLDTTYVRAFNPFYLFKKLIEKVTDGKITVKSDLLTTYSNVKITCGDAIRNIEGAKLKTTFLDFFKSFNTLFDIGLGEIHGVATLEEKSFFIDYNNPIQLGEVKDLKIRPANDYTYNTMKVGFKPKEYKDINGRQEFNNTMEFTTPVTRRTNELDLVSAYRADCYGIEFTRINFDGKKTTDSLSDNDVFLVHTHKAPYGFFGADNDKPTFEIERSLNAFVTGLLEPQSVFNIFLSPKRCLLRNGKFIHSTFFKMDNLKLSFQTTDKNAEMATTSPVIVEKANVNISALGIPLFLPIQLEFTCPTPVDLIEVLEASPIRSFEFTYLGLVLKGIPLKVGIKAGDMEAQTFTLLSAPTNNLANLINVFE